MKYAVIKIGGSILSDLCDTIIEDIHALRKIITPIIVHGGGPFIKTAQ